MRPAGPVAETGPEHAEIPLSYAQDVRRLAVAAGTEHQRPVTFNLRIDGELDLEALLSALRGLVRRHDALRLRIRVSSDGSAVQWAGPVPDDRQLVRSLQLARATDEQFDAYARKTLLTLMQQPFDPEHDAPCRFVLVRLDARTHALLASFSPLTVDEHSRRLLIQQVWQLYSEHTDPAGPTHPGGDGPAFLDVVREQRERFAHRAGTVNARYWQAREAELTELAERTEPTERAERAELAGSAAGAGAPAEPGPAAMKRLDATMDGVRLTDLRAQCEAQRTNLSHRLFGHFLQRVFSVVESDWLVVDFPVVLRSGPVDDVVGMFVLGVPLVVRRHETVQEQMRSVARGLLGAMSRCHVEPSVMLSYRNAVAVRCAQLGLPRLTTSHSSFEIEGGRQMEPAGLKVTVGAFNPRVLLTARGVDFRADEYPTQLLLTLVWNDAVVAGAAVDNAMRGLVAEIGATVREDEEVSADDEHGTERDLRP